MNIARLLGYSGMFLPIRVFGIGLSFIIPVLALGSLPLLILWQWQQWQCQCPGSRDEKTHQKIEYSGILGSDNFFLLVG